MMLKKKIIILYIILSVFTRQKKRKRRIYQRKKTDCYAKECFYLEYFLATNCIFNCVSKICFHKIYRFSNLEPGEIDSKRDKLFEKCFYKNEL